MSCNNSGEKEKNNNVITIKHSDTIQVTNQIDTGTNIYLTFDDGPYSTTASLANTLIDSSTKASFFIIGSQIAHSIYYDSVFLSVKGNKLFRTYNHTYSHAVTHGKIHNYYKDPINVLNDINRNKQYFDSNCNITRLPGTNAWRLKNSNICVDKNSKRVIKFLDSIQSNEKIFGWDFEWTIKESQDSIRVNKFYERIANRVMENKSNQKNYVILFHDYLFRSKLTLDNLQYFISLLKNKLNCKFKWAEEYPDIK